VKYLLISFILIGCSNRNIFTTQLLNDKKIIEDSIKEVGNYESYYIQQAKEARRTSPDSLKWQSLTDSSTYFFTKGRALKERLKAIDFSLDSLSRMK
jgi:hypothetical protein